MSTSKPKELISYEMATFGYDEPEIMWMPLGHLRKMVQQIKSGRADVAKFLALSIDMADDVLIVLTRDSIGVSK